jgi:hypothetical protein
MTARRFIIACPARSGSTMLVHMVRSHPDCVSNSEVMAFTEHAGGFDTSSRTYVDQLGGEAALVKWRRNDPIDFMNRAAFYADDHLWGGFKIKSDELVLRQYLPVLQALQADVSIKVLHLNRTNLLERYVSWVMVNDVTGVTMAVRQEDVPDFGTVKINPKRAERDFLLAEERQAKVDEWFSNHDMLQLEYEALTLDPMAESKRICAFLDIEERLLTTRTIKIAPHVSTLVSNFEQLQEYFAGSRFERLFDAASPNDTAPQPALQDTAIARYRIPGYLRSPRTEWGRGGATFGAYVAAACDLVDLADQRILAVGAHTDMIEAIARGECDVLDYVGLEESTSYVGHCEANPPADSVHLMHFDITRLRDDTQWLLRGKFDVVIVRAEFDDEATFGALIRGLRSVVREGARMLVTVGQAGDEARTIGDSTIMTLAAVGWRADEWRFSRRSLPGHIICTAVVGG